MAKHLVVPDCQIRPGDDFTFLKAIGNYIVAKQPDVIINIGDFADLPSLSSYDVGKKSFEGRRYKADVEAVKEAMGVLLAPLNEYNERQRKNGKKQYKPRMVLTLGNHENRIARAVNDDPKLDGVLSVNDLAYAEAGWEVHPFLEVVEIDGVAYCHYFTSGPMGRPVGTAAMLLNKKHQSCIAGHQQGLQIATAYKANGNPITASIAGSAYVHSEDYMGPQGNKHWRGILVLHGVNDGAFDLMPVSLEYLMSKYK